MYNLQDERFNSFFPIETINQLDEINLFQSLNIQDIYYLLGNFDYGICRISYNNFVRGSIHL